jgi:hypothetical protein
MHAYNPLPYLVKQCILHASVLQKLPVNVEIKYYDRIITIIILSAIYFEFLISKPLLITLGRY